jgi:hypothetical protein
MTPELRTEWICSGCDVHCFKEDRDPFPAPGGWDLDADLCKVCSREAETPIDKARRLVLAGKSNGNIKIKGLSAAMLNKLRTEAIEAGDLPPEAVKNNSGPHLGTGYVSPKTEVKMPFVEDTLRDEPWVSDSTIAMQKGVSAKIVKLTRERLGVLRHPAATAERNRKHVDEAYRQNPDATERDVADLLNLSQGTVRKARKALGLPSRKPGPKRTATIGSN